MYYVWVSHAKGGKQALVLAQTHSFAGRFHLNEYSAVQGTRFCCGARTEGETNVIRFVSHFVWLHIHDAARREKEAKRPQHHFEVTDAETVTLYRCEVHFQIFASAAKYPWQAMSLQLELEETPQHAAADS